MVTQSFAQERRLVPLPAILAFVLFSAAYFVASQVIDLDSGAKVFAETVGIIATAAGLLFTMHRLVTIWTVDAGGIAFRVESRFKALVVRGRDILSIRWCDVEDVRLEPSGNVKITPVDPERFRKPLASLGPIRMRLRLGEDGSFVTKTLTESDALRLIEAWRAARPAAIARISEHATEELSRR